MKKSLSIVLVSILSLSAAAGLSTSVMALGFSDLIEAGKGHIIDLTDRITHEDQTAEGTVIGSGIFRDNDPGRDSVHYVNGTVSIVEMNGEKYIQLNSDFKAGLAPDLYLYTANHKVVDEQSLRNYTEVAKLKSGSGAQFYPVSHNFTEVIIWCKRFNQYMGAASIN